MGCVNLRPAVVLLATALVASPALVGAWGPPENDDCYYNDPDGDDLGNVDEFHAGTNPLDPDTDGGGCWDGWEVEHGLDPTDPEDDAEDPDSDGWSNEKEFLEGTDPLNHNTDGDLYQHDSTDPHPLTPDEDWLNVPGGISSGGGAPSGGMGQGQGEGQGGGQGNGQGNGQGQGGGQGQGQAQGQSQGPGQGGQRGEERQDSDRDGLVEFINGM